MNRIKRVLHDRRARRLGLTFMQIIGADCARCGKAFGIDGLYPSLYSPAKGVRVYACYGGCGTKPPTIPEPACSCGADPGTRETNQAATAEIAAGDGAR